MRILILGGGYAGVTLARRLSEAATVSMVDTDGHGCAYAEQYDIECHLGDFASVETLAERDAGDADIAIVASPTESKNLLAAQHLRTRFDVDRILVQVNDPRNLDIFEDRGMEPLCASTALTEAFVDGLGEERLRSDRRSQVA